MIGTFLYGIALITLTADGHYIMGMIIGAYYVIEPWLSEWARTP